MGQQYPGMPGGSPSHYPHQQQQYHDANMMAYYAQLPYSDPSTINPPAAAQYPNFYPPAAGYGHYPGYPPAQPPHGYPPQPHPGYPPMSPMYPAQQQPHPAAATAAAAAAQPQQQQQGSTGHTTQANAQQYETDDDKYEEEDGTNDEQNDDYADPRVHKVRGSLPVVHNRQPQAADEEDADERKPAARADLTRGGGVAHHPPAAGTNTRLPYRSPTADYTREDPELTSFFREAAFGNSPQSRTAAPMQHPGADPYHSYAQGTAQYQVAAGSANPLDIGNYHLPPSSPERARGHAVQPYPTRDEQAEHEEDPREHQEYQR